MQLEIAKLDPDQCQDPLTTGWAHVPARTTFRFTAEMRAVLDDIYDKGVSGKDHRIDRTDSQ